VLERTSSGFVQLALWRVFELQELLMSPPAEIVLFSACTSQKYLYRNKMQSNK